MRGIPHFQSRQPTSRLATELCEIIVEILTNDSETLKSLSLVSYAWMTIARRHLFRAVKAPGLRVLFHTSLPNENHLTYPSILCGERETLAPGSIYARGACKGWCLRRVPRRRYLLWTEEQRLLQTLTITSQAPEREMSPVV